MIFELSHSSARSFIQSNHKQTSRKLGCATGGMLRPRRSALLATTALLSAFLLPGIASAQTVVDNTTVTVPGTQATPWAVPDALIIGDVGSATLNIGSGGTPGVVTSVGGTVGSSVGADGTVTITGAGSKWDAAGALLLIGYAGTGNLKVSGGASVNAGAVLLGDAASGIGTVLVTGPGSSWNGVMTIGDSGQGDFTLDDHAAAKMNGANTIGLSTGSKGTLNILNGAAVDATGNLTTVGVSGTGFLNIDAGGTFASDGGKIGSSQGGNGTATVNGTGSRWDMTETLTVGDFGTGQLDVTSGGVVVSVGGKLGAQSNDGIGTVNVDGTGSKWNAAGALLLIGDAGTGNLKVSGGASVNAGAVLLGEAASGIGTVLVTGSGSSWNGVMTIGESGQGDFTLDDHATAKMNGANTIGLSTGSKGTLSILNGAAVDATGNLTTVGASGAGFLNIEAGGTLASDAGKIGSSQGGNGTATVNGAGSRWDMTETLTVGDFGTGQLDVKGGGTVTSKSGTMAIDFGSTGTATINGAGSRWDVASDLQIGVLGAATLTVSNGGALTTGTAATHASAYIGEGSASTNTNAVSSVTVTGPGSNWTVYGTLTAGNHANGQLTIADGGTVNVSDNAVIGYYPDGSGSALVTGAGSSLTVGQNLFLGGDNVYSANAGLTIANGGKVTVGNGAGIVNVAMGGAAFAQLNIGDTGMLAPGATPDAPGTLNASEVFLGQTGAVVFSHNSTNYTFAPKFSGVGQIFVYNGTTILTADSSGFTGFTSIEGGTLVVNGALGGTIEVKNAAGRLQGSGTLGDIMVSAGTLAPGNSIGTLNVGNITFNPGSIYEVEVNAAGQSDKIAATGTATINGGAVKVLAGMGNYAPATTYTILTANGGRTGTFTEGVTSNLAFLDPSLSYDANNVYLTMTRNGTAFRNVGMTPNQIATGGGVESLGFGNPVYDAVLNLSAPQAQYVFDQLSGEIHASAKTAMIEDSRFVRSAVNDRLRAAFDSVGVAKGSVVTYVDGQPVAVAATTDRLAVWGQGFGSWGHTDGDGNAARLNRSTAGFFIGADAPVFDTWRFGAVVGYSSTNFDVKDRHSSGLSDNYHLGLYGGTSWGDVAFRSGVAYTRHDVTTNRGVVFPGLGDSLKGDYNAGTAQVFGELGYGMNMGAARFEPFANLAYVSVQTDGFTEKGSAAVLTSQDTTTDATFTTLGLRASSNVMLGDINATTRGTLGWRHAFGDVTPLSVMRFAGGGDVFTIAGVPIARDAAVMEAGLDFVLSPAAMLGVTYGGQFGSEMSDQSVKANFNVKF